MAFESKIRTISWDNDRAKMLDQTIIPYEYKYIDITSGQQMFDAIKKIRTKQRKKIKRDKTVPLNNYITQPPVYQHLQT